MRKKTPPEETRDNPIRHIEYIARRAEGSRLSEEFMKQVRVSCKRLSYYLDCNPVQAVLFSVLCNINLTYRAVGIDRLSDWFGCTPITLAMYVNELEELRQRKILRKEVGESSHDADDGNSISSICYAVNPQVFESLRKGEKYIKLEIIIRDNYDLVKAIGSLIQQRFEGVIDFREMYSDIDMILAKQSGMEFLRELRQFNMQENEKYLFLNLCDDYYNGCTSTDLAPTVKLITSNQRDQMTLRSNIVNGYSSLARGELIECGESVFRNDKDISLTTKALEMLLRDEPTIVLEKKEFRMPDMIQSASITEKRLYFPPEIQDRYSEISDLLIPANYDKLVKRLRKAGMRTGFAMLFEGPPGTGKTESVYQLARTSGRDVLQVNISDLKTKWYGESQKLVSGMFNRYRKLAEKSEIIPLLLFNEADGVFTTRYKNADSYSDTTENAIQAIILQSLEDLKGILIATTNFSENLDKAFDRRFLYKVHFGKPTPETRFRIWQEKVPFLSDTATMELAEAYDLSGGQIENIARKCTMHRVLKGKNPLRAQIDAWCREETGKTETVRIGFRYEA